MVNFKQEHWFLKDLQYEYLDDGFKLTAYTDVPCHLYARMTTTPPLKHALPSRRRGTYLQGDIRFCFVVYEDNEQDEARDTLTHTWLKSAWPVCETRWFYFVGTIAGKPAPSESPIFKFHFPAPPPEPPDPIYRVLFSEPNNRTVRGTALTWPPAHDAPAGEIMTIHDPPLLACFAGSALSAGWHYIWRSFLTFDTTVMAPTAKILSAEVSPYVYLKLGVSAAFPIHVTLGVQHDPVIATDYGDQLPVTTSGGSSPIPEFGYQPIALNSMGLLMIKPGNITKFCLRGHVDLTDGHPVAVYNNQIFYYSEQKGAGYRPTLAVTYFPA